MSATVSKDGSSFFWDDARSTAPYAVLFVLFLCGRHKLGLRYLKEYYSESHLTDGHRAVIAALRDLYKSYFDRGCKGLARNQVKPFYENALSADAPRDEYKTLLVHIMVGSRSREDSEFFSSVLFADTDIQTWYFLKLAGFEFLQEQGSDYIQQIEMTVALPLSYKSFSLQDHQSKISDILRNQRSGSQQPHEMLQLLKALFYSGQFTEFV